MVAFIGYSSVSHSQASADVPRTTKWYGPIWTADFDRIWANIRQCWIIPGGVPEKEAISAARTALTSFA
jgi:hypothetical protein